MKSIKTGLKRDNNEVSRPAVFLDRDGTIIEDRGDLSDSSQVVFFNDTVASLLRLGQRYHLFIVTNQSGVSKGTISMHDVEQVNLHITSFLERQGIKIIETYVCPHDRMSGCHCIKPNPYFLNRAKDDYQIDLRHSFVIGDHPHDVDFAESVGATGIYVLSGHGRKHQSEIADDTVVKDGIRGAAEHILQIEVECRQRS